MMEICRLDLKFYRAKKESDCRAAPLIRFSHIPPFARILPFAGLTASRRIP
jgi:hypothetical protein